MSFVYDAPDDDTSGNVFPSARKFNPSPARAKAPAAPTRHELMISYLFQDYRLAKKIAATCLPGGKVDVLGSARLDEKANWLPSDATIRVRVPYIADVTLRRSGALHDKASQERDIAHREANRRRCRHEALYESQEAHRVRLEEIDTELNEKLATRLVFAGDDVPQWRDETTGTHLSAEWWRTVLEIVDQPEEVDLVIERLAMTRSACGLNAAFLVADTEINTGQSERAQALGVSIIGLGKGFETYAAQRLPSKRPAKLDIV